MTHVRKNVFLLDGPIGVGKTTLGSAVADRLGLSFIDRDEHAGPGHWIRSVQRTSHGILVASLKALETHPGVVVAGPVRCVDWLFFDGHFRRKGVSCFCVGLIADSAHIESRARTLSTQERCRSREMIQQGYGQRLFRHATLRTDSGDFGATMQRLDALLTQLSQKR